MNMFSSTFEDRGYPPDLINSEFSRAMSLERADLLKHKVYPHGAALTPLEAEKPKFKPTFIITYHPSGPKLRNWIREAFPILQSDKILKKIYPSVVFRQSANLRQILVHSALRELPFRDCSDREEQETAG